MPQNKWVFGGIGVVVGALITEGVDYWVVYAKARNEAKVLAKLEAEAQFKAAVEAARAAVKAAA